MDVVDKNRLEKALIYLQRITEGKNPVNNMPLDDDSELNNPNVISCMSFIKDVLEELRRNDGYIGRRPRKDRDNSKLDFPVEELKTFQYTGSKTITKIVEQLNGLVDIGKYKKLTYEPIKEWLIKNDYLREVQQRNSNKKSFIPTTKGIEIGIKAEKNSNPNGPNYTYLFYGKQAQEIIVENMEEILNY